ncbi:MAG: GNAT family N-acetyltransferase [Clostridiaceae bacterium]
MSIKELLKGEKVRLTAFSEEDFETLKSWFADPEFSRYYDYMPAVPKSVAQLKAMIAAIEESRDNYVFAIRENDGGKLIGICGYEDIVWNNQTARIYIGLGNQEHRGRGFASEALRLAIDFGFMELNLHYIYLTVISYNRSAINLYERVGFSREGANREFILRDSQRYDLYIYGLLRREWKEI